MTRIYDVPPDCDPVVDRGTFAWDDCSGVYGTVRLEDVRYVISDGDHVEVGCEHIVIRLESPATAGTVADGRRMTDWWNAIVEVEQSLRTTAVVEGAE